MNKVHQRSFVVISTFFTSHFQASLDSLLACLGRGKKLGLAIMRAELRLYRVCIFPTRYYPSFSTFSGRKTELHFQSKNWTDELATEGVVFNPPTFFFV